MNAIWAIALKDLKLLLRDRSAAFFTFGFPLLLSIFFGVIFGGVGGDGETAKMKIVAVNEDGGPAGKSFIDDLAADDALDVITGRAGGTTDKAGAEAAPLLPYTREEATELVRKGRATACVIVPKGFEESSSDMFSGGGLNIEALVDPAHNAEAGLLTGKLNEIAFRQMSGTFSDPARMTKSLDRARASITTSIGLSEAQKGVLGSLFNSLDGLSKSDIKIGGTPTPTKPSKEATDKAAPTDDATGGGWMPVHVTVSEIKPQDRPGPKNSFEISFPQGVVWGLMGCVTAFGASMASERTRGTLMRLSVAPISREQVLVGKALSCFVACVLVQVLLLLIASIPILGVKVREPGMMGIAILVNSFGFTGVMMIMSGLSRTEGAASGMGRALIIMLAMIGGGTIPLMFMPAFMAKVSSISPFKWAIMATEGALWRGYSLSDMALPAAVLGVIGIVGFIIGAVSLRRAQAV